MDGLVDTKRPDRDRAALDLFLLVGAVLEGFLLSTMSSGLSPMGSLVPPCVKNGLLDCTSELGGLGLKTLGS